MNPFISDPSHEARGFKLRRLRMNFLTRENEVLDTYVSRCLLVTQFLRLAQSTWKWTQLSGAGLPLFETVTA